ncbi:MAG: ABC transporter permease [Spirochaetaceae bacterium]
MSAELFRVAWKNVFRNSRRSILNIIALTVGMTIMVLGLGWVQGYYTYIFTAVQEFNTGDAQVLPDRYLAEAPRLPVDITVSDYTTTRALIGGFPGVVEAAGRVNFSLRLSTGRSSVRMLAKGIDPEREARVTVLDEHITVGAYLSERPGILIGAPVAERLELGPGDTVFVSAMDRFSVENLLDVRVVGIFDFGYPAMDRNVVFLDLATASELLSLDNEVTRLVLRLEDGLNPRVDLEELAAYVTEQAPGGPDLSVHPWQRFAETTVQSVRADVSSFYIMLAVLYLLTVLGILNSMSMSVRERTGEIGTLRAIGIRRRRIMLLFLWEAVCIALIAAALSVVLSLPVAAYLQIVGVDVGTALPADIPLPFGDTFRADYRVWHYPAAVGVGAASAALGAVIPAKRAAHLNIAEAMAGKR